MNDAPYNKTTTHAHETLQVYIPSTLLNYPTLLLYNKDIYIEMRDWTETDNLRMTIDARKIISNLDIPLENAEWETLQNVKWGPLINETYDDQLVISLILQRAY